VPFREAHAIVGKAVAHCIDAGMQLHEMDASACVAIDTRLTVALVRTLSVESSVAARNHVGGTASVQVREQCTQWKTQLENADA